MKILALEQELPGNSREDYSNHRKAEALKLWELQQADFIRECWFRRDEDSAVLILEASDVADAQKTLQELPYVRLGLIEFDLVPLRPYPGFGRLFNEEEGA